MSQQTKEAATKAWERLQDKGQILNRASFEIGFGECAKEKDATIESLKQQVIALQNKCVALEGELERKDAEAVAFLEWSSMNARLSQTGWVRYGQEVTETQMLDLFRKETGRE